MHTTNNSKGEKKPTLLAHLMIGSADPELSTNDNGLLLRERILRDFQVQWRRPFSRAPGDVVVRAVAGAKPASEIAGFANGDATEMCADA